MDLNEGKASIERFALIQKAQLIERAIGVIGLELDALIESDGLANRIPATCLFNFVSEMFEFKEQ